MAVRILVTGGSGFIGRHAVAELHNLDFEVHVIGRQSGDSTIFAPQVIRHQVDVLDRRAVSDLIRTIRPTHLLHLAWITTHGAYWRSPDNLDWLAATVHLARTFAEAGGSRMVTAGTSAEYDWTDPKLASSNCFEYSTPIIPRTFYGVTKDACRRALEAYSTESGIQTAWGRVFFLFGPSEDQRRLVP
jgi:nucleoside-diphosphate-sugar epimerase